MKTAGNYSGGDVKAKLDPQGEEERPRSRISRKSFASLDGGSEAVGRMKKKNSNHGVHGGTRRGKDFFISSPWNSVLLGPSTFIHTKNLLGPFAMLLCYQRHACQCAFIWRVVFSLLFLYFRFCSLNYCFLLMK
jgi:hypothetical protein